MKSFHFISILLVFLFSCGISNGQNYHPLLNDSTTWDAWSHDYTLPACSDYAGTRVFVNGDTVINSLTYSRISGFNATNITPMPCPVWAFDNTTTQDFAFLREDTSLQKVWAFNPNLGSEYLLFDFSLMPGDTHVTSFGQNPLFHDSLIVDSVGVIQLADGSFRKIIHMHLLAGVFIQEYMIEGIGGSAGMYLPPLNWGIGFGTLLGCVIYNNDQLYNPTSFSTYCPGIIGNTNIIRGKAFVDLNSNLIFDAGDSPLDYVRVNANGTGMFDFTDTSGNYQVYVTDTGNFNVTGAVLNNFISNPISHTAYFSAFSQTDSTNDFAYQPISIFDELQLILTPMHKFRAGYNATYKLWIRNRGTTNQTSVVVFYQDSALQYFTASLTPAVTSADSITWNLPNLAPFQQTSFTVTFNVNSGLPIGTPVNSFAQVLPALTDAFPLNNYDTSNAYIHGPYDPNDISVDRGTLFTNEMANPPFLNYLIRFQNVGNDTAFVVRIENGLYQTLDVSTLEFVSSSHPCQMNWNYLLNQVEFIFQGINLPDSTTDEIGSHGYVAYRIKPVSGLMAGQFISIKADIYFDFNLPISTNYALTHIEEPTALSEILHSDEGFQLFPNPVAETLNIAFKKADTGNCKIKIIDITGRIIQEQTIEGVENRVVVNLVNLADGIYFVKVSKGTTKGIKKIVKL
ncbi:MAG: T9SS type A sorting domain-containing protein [Bacteroidetes bacterium]|nr:T9SS type A sorting domain-containing protein [Bacteroidota bacterium]